MTFVTRCQDVGESGRGREFCPVITESHIYLSKERMANIHTLLEMGNNISVNVSVADLKEFALAVANEVMAARQAEREEEKYLSPDEVAEMVGVCTNTLWRWNNDKYLCPVKVGRKSRYKLSDVKRIMEGRL